jgi:hypothetical protein
MRNLTLSLLLLIPSFIFAQQKTDTTKESKKIIPYYIETCTDKMTDKSYAFGSKSLLCSDDGKKGFIISVSWNNKGGEVTYGGLSVKSVGIGSCVENSTLILLFEDDTKEQIGAWNKFNCEGNSYMDWQGKSYDKIFGKKVKSIRFQNGRTFDSYTYNLNGKEKDYFVEVASALSEKRIVPGSCD